MKPHRIRFTWLPTKIYDIGNGQYLGPVVRKAWFEDIVEIRLVTCDPFDGYWRAYEHQNPTSRTTR